MDTQEVMSSRWRLNNSLFQDPTFKHLLSEQPHQFLQIKLGSTQSIGTVWEASKAVIRHTIITNTSKLKRESKEKISE